MNDLEHDYPFLTIMHPAHFQYIRRLSFNHVGQLIEALDKLDPERRREILGEVVYLINGGTLKDFTNDESAYDLAKSNLRKIASHPISSLVVVGIVHYTLYNLLRMGDVTDLERQKSKLVGFAESQMDKGDEPSSWLIDHIENLPEQTDRSHENYVYFCEQVLVSLIDAACP